VIVVDVLSIAGLNMEWDPDFKPRLRPLEAFAIPDGDGSRVGLRDPSGLSDLAISLSGAALHIMTLMDGVNTCQDIRDKFQATLGTVLPSDTLQSMVTQLEQARFLDGSGFESYYQSLLEEYRSKSVRGTPKTSALGIIEDLGAFFDDILADADPPPLPGPVVGLIAPHLDYARGRPCYAAAYATLRNRAKPHRVVILGTNHFGRSTSVVATVSHFRTPLGTTSTDAEFLQRVEGRCGDLRTFELDHAREHSVDLQVAWLQHLFGADSFLIVPILCPDPSGPTGTAPADGRGVDLGEFAEALGDLVADDDHDTLIVAGADLTHAGAGFGDKRPLDTTFKDEIRTLDRGALANLEVNDPARWIACVAKNGNPTRICSAGCIFTLATALRGASGTILRYHQAVDDSSQTCVTCAAVAFS
jgi:AmmeMemoRadiSam system protein B